MKTKSKLLNAMTSTQSAPKQILTENGALTYANSGNYVLDLFSMGGAVRNRPDNEVVELFKNAYKENALLAMKTIFYLRDVRGGMGERKCFRLAWNWLCNTDEKVAKKNLDNVPFYGRWDDLVEASVGTPLEKDAFSLVGKQLTADVLQEDDHKLSIVSKWLPSINTSSSSTRSLAKKLCKYLEMSEKEYRKTLSKLRSRLNVVEKLMTAHKWSKIEYSHVPSRASSIYKNAFKKHDEKRYSEWQNKAVKGEVKVNSGTLYPYDIVRDIRRNPNNKTLEAQWKQLPNYLSEDYSNMLVVADVSGSMTSGYGANVAPIDVCISLALYISERNNGYFKDHFLTFSNHSRLQKVVGDSLTARINNLERAEWGMSTNIQSTFDAILDAAVKNKLSQKDMPSNILVISDMEFNSACTGTNFEVAKAKFKSAGFTLPTVTFWNVNSRQNNVAAKKNDKGVFLVSGCSPSILTHVLSAGSKTPEKLMLEVLNSERYERVKV